MLKDLKVVQVLKDLKVQLELLDLKVQQDQKVKKAKKA